nr:hypothetical protein TetV2_00195 [Oceanusvirus sp.]
MISRGLVSSLLGTAIGPLWSGMMYVYGARADDAEETDTGIRKTEPPLAMLAIAAVNAVALTLALYMALLCQRKVRATEVALAVVASVPYAVFRAFRPCARF